MKNDQVEISGDGFAGKEGVHCKFTGSQLSAGTSSNTFTYNLNKGAKAGNYNITTVEGTLTVTPRTVIVTPTAASKNVDDKDPELKAKVSNLVKGDKIQYTLTRESGKDVGTYDIYSNGETSQGNYVVSFETLEDGFTIKEKQQCPVKKLIQCLINLF